MSEDEELDTLEQKRMSVLGRRFSKLSDVPERRLSKDLGAMMRERFKNSINQKKDTFETSFSKNNTILMNKTIGAASGGFETVFNRTSTLGGMGPMSPAELKKLPTMSKGPAKLVKARHDVEYRRSTKQIVIN